MNSSYVLISTTPSARLGNGGMHPIGCLGKYIILLYAPAALKSAREILLLIYLQFVIIVLGI